MKKILSAIIFSLFVFFASATVVPIPLDKTTEPTRNEVKIHSNRIKMKSNSKPVTQWQIVVHCGNGGGGTLCCYDTYAEALADVQFAIQWYCTPPFNV